MPEKGDAKTIYGKPFAKYNGYHWVNTYDPFFEPKKTDTNISDMIIELVGHDPYRKASGSLRNGIIYRLPDLLWVSQGKVAVVVEIDNDSNYGSDTSYEVQKIIEQNKTIRMIEGCENIVVNTIRINPDTYDGGHVATKDRVDKVVRWLRDILYKIETEDEDEDDNDDEDDDENNRNPLKAIVTPYHSDNDDEDDDENNRNPLKAIVTPYHSDNEDDGSENEQKVKDRVLFCYYHSKSWNHIDAHSFEFVCHEITSHEYLEYDRRIYKRYYFEQCLERRRKYDEKHYDALGRKRPEAIMTKYKYDGNKEKQREYNRKCAWKSKGVIGDLDAIHERWLNAINCEVCGIRLGGNASEMKCMDHDHDTGEFRYILCMSCNNHDRWKEVLDMKSLEKSNNP